MGGEGSCPAEWSRAKSLFFLVTYCIFGCQVDSAVKAYSWLVQHSNILLYQYCIPARYLYSGTTDVKSKLYHSAAISIELHHLFFNTAKSFSSRILNRSDFSAEFNYFKRPRTRGYTTHTLHTTPSGYCTQSSGQF